MEFNINNHIRIKMTPLGRELHKKYWTEIMSGAVGWTYNPKKEDAEGWSKWQMWDVMQVFGEHMHNGCIMPFEPTIIIEENQ